MRIMKIIAGLVIAASILTGCAHPIVIGPDVTKIEPSDADHPASRNVAYYISDDLHNAQVTTPGGGGDKISYQPYRDIEAGFYKMLTNAYGGSVTKLKSPTDSDAITKNNISYVITPILVTNSSSPSAFTWPPTQFTVELTCKINDASGNLIAEKKATGHGNAEFDEFKHDFGLSAKRASLEALLNMQHELSNTN